jgi:hypothetical protein
VPEFAVDMPCTVTEDELFHSPPKLLKLTPGRSSFPNTTSCTDKSIDRQTDIMRKHTKIESD